MIDAIFSLDGDMATPTPFAMGPWDPTLQHGSAPSSLAIHFAERLPSAQPMRIARLTIDLLRPVPLAPLKVVAAVLRDGRKIQVCSVELHHGSNLVARATVLKMRRAAQSLPDGVQPRPVTEGGPETGVVPTRSLMTGGFVDGLTMKVVRGGFRTLQPGAVWFQARRPIVDGEPISQAARAVIASDFCNGVSAVLPFDAWTFVNGDLTVTLARDPVGDWILLDAETWLGDDGGGIAAGMLADQHGYFGRAIQNLVIDRR